MEALDCIKTRRSTRKFTPQPVSRETLAAIMEAVRFAPSWKNTQTVRYTVVEDPALLAVIAENAVNGFAYNTKTIARCAALAVQTVVTGASGRGDDGGFATSKEAGWEMYDAGISAQTFCLAAHALGVSSVIMGIINEDKLREILSLPEGEAVAGAIALGYAEAEGSAPPRKEVGELLRFA